MSVYESIIKGLNEAIEHQSGTKPARSVKRMSVEEIGDAAARYCKENPRS